MSTDSYKQTHHVQYVPGLEYVYSYFEPRKGAIYKDIVWMGVIPYIKEYGLDGYAFEHYDILEAVKICDEHFGVPGYFNEKGWRYILDTYAGRLPLRISQLPAGTIVKPGTPCMAIENTDPKVPWLTNYVESILMHVYASTNTATISYDVYKTIKKWADRCGECVSPVHLNDFGLRGSSSLQSAETCGMGHLLIFSGSDNIPSIKCAMECYSSGVVGVSVIAAEHSTITSWGKENEFVAYSHIIKTAPDSAIISLVIDSFDWKNAIDTMFCGNLRDLILSRSGKVVCRPDSEDHIINVPYILKKLWEVYGGSINKNGYKVLDPHIGIIVGDGVNVNIIDSIYYIIVNDGFAPSNVIWGSGGYLLQQHDRDTLGFAFKCSAIRRNGIWYDVKKTTPGKESKAGRFPELEVVYENGVILKDESFTEIRNRIRGVL